jgi:carbon-monoxide dehydrogenase large subunit
MSATSHTDSPVGDTVGRPLPRIESREKVTGRAIYTDDLIRPRMLYAAVTGSPYAHARIKRCDVAAAEAVPGVKAVLTGESLPVHPTGIFLSDQLALARGKVRYIGEPVAAIAASDLDTARRALTLIEIEYEELEPVFDPVAALAPGAPVIHEDRDRYHTTYPLPAEPNAINYCGIKEGDPDAAWAQCDVIVEAEYELPAQSHMYLEPVASLAEVDDDGRITVWTSTQGVSSVQAHVAEALGLPMSKVRIIAPRVGGGFGAKGDLTNQVIAAALAQATRRPVTLTATRDEDMTTMKCRHSGRIRMKTGARSDGTLLARSAEIILNGGAYADESPGVLGYSAFFSRGPYRIPNMEVRAWAVYTNMLRAGAFRGFGNPQTTFASESQVDEIAIRLGRDPIDLRLRNAIETGDRWLGGQRVEVGSLRACLERVRNASDWDRKRAAKAVPGRRRGVGVAAVAHICSFLSAGATVRLNQDGTITVVTGAQDIGQGSDTVLAQIAAGSLGLTLDEVKYVSADSDTAPYNFQTAGSRVTYTVGTAVRQACERIKEKIFAAAGEMLECATEDLELRPGGLVGIKGVKEAQLPFAAVAGRSLFESGGPISGSHDWIFPAQRFDPKHAIVQGFHMTEAAGIFIFAAQVVELEVDEATGQVHVLEVHSVHDVGRAINPLLVEGQIEGGIAQGLGYGLTEELVFEDGRLTNASMMDYKVPGMADLPYRIQPLLLEMPEASGPFGAKGVGEIGLVGAAAAAGNAIRHAIGARLTRLPATPERVLAAMLNP